MRLGGDFARQRQPYACQAEGLKPLTAGSHGAGATLGWGTGSSCSWRLSLPLPHPCASPPPLYHTGFIPWMVDADAAVATQHIKPPLLRSCIHANTL